MAADDRPLASLALTHVFYDPADPVAYVCAWLALLPQALCVAYAVLLAATREAEVALMFAGQLGCEALNFALKRLIREERPPRMNGKGYGMPSSHAQFAAYWALYLALFLLLRHRPTAAASTSSRRASSPPSSSSSSASPAPASASASAPSPRRAGPPRAHALLSAGVLLLALLVALSRVHLRYHTPPQAAAGSAAGLACAAAWFGVVGWARRRGWVLRALETPAAAWLRARDLVCDVDEVEAGWRRWRAMVRARRRAGRAAKAR